MMLKNATNSASQPDTTLKEKLSENEKLMKEMSLTWEEKLYKTGEGMTVLQDEDGLTGCVSTQLKTKKHKENGF